MDPTLPVPTNACFLCTQPITTTKPYDCALAVHDNACSINTAAGISYYVATAISNTITGTGCCAVTAIPYSLLVGLACFACFAFCPCRAECIGCLLVACGGCLWMASGISFD